MQMLYFQNGIYKHKNMPSKSSSYIINNSNQSLEFQEYVPYSNCLCTLNINDPVKYINTDCLKITFDDNTIVVYPWMQAFFITVKDLDSVVIGDNAFGHLSVTQL